MARFVLQACKYRGGRFTPDRRAEPLVITDVEQLMHRFCMTPAHVSVLRTGGYVGCSRSKRTGQPCCFVLRNNDHTGSYGWVQEADPTFAARILEVFRVELARWDARLVE